jgi:siroheme synthase
VTLVTAHAAQGAPDVDANVPREGTLVFYMGLGRLEETCAALVASGRASETPAAVVSRATLPDARTVIGTLGDLAERVRDARIEAPAIVVVGEVISRRVVSPAADPEPPVSGARASGV